MIATIVLTPGRREYRAKEPHYFAGYRVPMPTGFRMIVSSCSGRAPRTLLAARLQLG